MQLLRQQLMGFEMLFLAPGSRFKELSGLITEALASSLVTAH
ncbi:hypothetical protein [Prosthecobacter vanneervenii]|uniref:Uncharacterized protein n=1 Tax=Prosthecobacter vanneervenii TaxID=48466 RepID=A0A7W7YG10_9BACT|nr:hypothetical protein [Prosthecobacter vanneervenii]MBB5035459.1 hypothetical protein [Prosthecobacter vanneervenii]